MEPMDIDVDSVFDNKENSFRHNLLPKTPSTEKGYEELDVSELNMKLRYSITPASSPMSKSFTASCLDNKNYNSAEENCNTTMVNENSILTRSLNTTLNKSDNLLKSPKSLPLQSITTDQITDINWNSARRLEPQMDNNITVTGTHDNDNLSLPSTSSSVVATPEATTPTKDIKNDEGSPIMRGLKSVLSMFRSSQSPIPPPDNKLDNEINSTQAISEELPEQVVLASTPLSNSKHKDNNLSKRSSPRKESVIFNDDLERELEWKDETTILFKEEKIPIHKLLFQQPLCLNAETKLNQFNQANTNLNSTVEYMDISFNDFVADKTMAEIEEIPNKSETVVTESDSEFVDCETTFGSNEHVNENESHVINKKLDEDIIIKDKQNHTLTDDLALTDALDATVSMLPGDLSLDASITKTMEHEIDIKLPVSCNDGIEIESYNVVSEINNTQIIEKPDHIDQNVANVTLNTDNESIIKENAGHIMESKSNEGVVKENVDITNETNESTIKVDVDIVVKLQENVMIDMIANHNKDTVSTIKESSNMVNSSFENQSRDGSDNNNIGNNSNESTIKDDIVKVTCDTDDTYENTITQNTSMMDHSCNKKTNDNSDMMHTSNENLITDVKGVSNNSDTRINDHITQSSMTNESADLEKPTQAGTHTPNKCNENLDKDIEFTKEDKEKEYSHTIKRSSTDMEETTIEILKTEINTSENMDLMEAINSKPEGQNQINASNFYDNIQTDNLVGEEPLTIPILMNGSLLSHENMLNETCNVKKEQSDITNVVAPVDKEISEDTNKKEDNIDMMTHETKLLEQEIHESPSCNIMLDSVNNCTSTVPDNSTNEVDTKLSISVKVDTENSNVIEEVKICESDIIYNNYCTKNNEQDVRLVNNDTIVLKTEINTNHTECTIESNNMCTQDTFVNTDDTTLLNSNEELMIPEQHITHVESPSDIPLPDEDDMDKATDNVIKNTSNSDDHQDFVCNSENKHNHSAIEEESSVLTNLDYISEVQASTDNDKQQVESDIAKTTEMSFEIVQDLKDQNWTKDINTTEMQIEDETMVITKIYEKSIDEHHTTNLHNVNQTDINDQLMEIDSVATSINAFSGAEIITAELATTSQDLGMDQTFEINHEKFEEEKKCDLTEPDVASSHVPVNDFIDDKEAAIKITRADCEISNTIKEDILPNTANENVNFVNLIIDQSKNPIVDVIQNTESKMVVDSINTADKTEPDIGIVDEEIITSANNSPYVSLTEICQDQNEKPNDGFQVEDNPFVTKANLADSPPISPKITSRGYNFNFDEIDDPFATKTNIRMSPTPDTPLNNQLIPNENMDEKKNNRKNDNKRRPQTERKKLAVIKKKINTTFDAKLDSTREEINQKTDSIVQDKIKMNSETLKDPQATTTEAVNEVEHYGVNTTATEFELESDKSSRNLDVTMAEKSTSSSEQYFSAGTSSGDSIMSKNVFNLPEIDDVNFNPFATKSKLCLSHESVELNSKYVAQSSPNTLSPMSRIEDKKEDRELILSPNLSDTTSLSQISDDKNITTKEVKTEEEDTLEGPFLEADDITDVDKLSDFDTENDMIQFNDLPIQETDENTEGGELFIDAEAFEFLLNQNKNNVVEDCGKESLFLKFDPLFAKRVSSDGVLTALSKVQKRQNITKNKPPQKEVNLDGKDRNEQIQAIAGPSTDKISSNVTEENTDDPNMNLNKPMMVVNPAVSSMSYVSPKKSTPPKINRRSLTFTSPAMAVIDRLLSLSGNTSLLSHDTSIPPISREHTETDLALTQLRELLAEKEINVHNLRMESKELRDRLATLESQVRCLETESEGRLRKVNDLNECLSEKTKINKSMATVVEEYERTIASLIAETESDKKRHAEERMQLIKERDEQTAHLSSMEVSFSDLHSKYEKSKQIILSYKANEDTYRQSIKEFEDNLNKMQNNYELLKQHATSKLNHANQELEKINRAHEAEVLKLNAMIKRKELHITSLEETLTQKTKANEELTAICDELINKVG